MRLRFPIVWLLPALLAAAGCAAIPVATDNPFYGLPPADWKKDVLAHLAANLKDPDSMKTNIEAAEAAPREFSWGCRRFLWSAGTRVNGWCSVVKVNARNSYGGYAGAELYIFCWKDNALVSYYQLRRLEDFGLPYCPKAGPYFVSADGEVNTYEAGR